MAAIEALEKEIDEKDFIMKRLEKDKSIIVNILQSTIADLEKSKQKIEASNIKLIEHQNELNTQKKIIENKSQKLRDNLKKLEHSYNELEEFTHIASHDLKSPLRSISGFAYLLQKKYKNQIDEAADHYLDFIISSASHMHEVIEALLRYSRVGNKSDHFELVDLNNVLQTTLDNLSIEIDENQAQIESQDLPTVKGDKISLVQLFQNLISNAIKFKSDRPPLIKFDCKKTESVWQFKCTDNGIGIDEIYQDKIFFPFQRLEDQPQSGMGLGLAICKKVITVHNGSIRFEKNPNGGTIFIFELPVTTDKVRES
jgi:chemotaxis family two-component system sensor kinase Cph1